VASVGVAVAVGSACAVRLVELHHQHRDAQRVRQQDAFLPLVVAGLPDLGQELDRGHPFLRRQVELAHQRVGVTHDAGHDLLEARVGVVGQAVENGLGDVGGLVLAHGCSCGAGIS
jgi:hypothetical protein